MSERENLLRKELDRDLSILKSQYNPLKVILFGSLISGNIGEWSDIDLMIVKDTDKSFYDRSKEVFALLKPQVGMDIIVYTSQEYKEMQGSLFFKEEILSKSKVLYERN